MKRARLSRIQFDAPAVTPRLKAGGCSVRSVGLRQQLADFLAQNSYPLSDCAQPFACFYFSLCKRRLLIFESLDA